MIGNENLFSCRPASCSAAGLLSCCPGLFNCRPGLFGCRPGLLTCRSGFFQLPPRVAYVMSWVFQLPFRVAYLPSRVFSCHPGLPVSHPNSATRTGQKSQVFDTKLYVSVEMVVTQSHCFFRQISDNNCQKGQIIKKIFAFSKKFIFE